MKMMFLVMLYREARVWFGRLCPALLVVFEKESPLMKWRRLSSVRFLACFTQNLEADSRVVILGLGCLVGHLAWDFLTLRLSYLFLSFPFFVFFGLFFTPFGSFKFEPRNYSVIVRIAVVNCSALDLP